MTFAIFSEASTWAVTEDTDDVFVRARTDGYTAA